MGAVQGRGYQKDTPQVPVYGTCGKYLVWYQTTKE